MPNTLRQIPLNETGGVTGASLKREGLDQLSKLGRAVRPIGRGLSPERESQLTRQTAGTTTTPSQLRPQPQPQPQPLGQAATENIEQVKSRVEPQTVRQQAPSIMPALQALSQKAQEPVSRAQQAAQKLMEGGSKLFGTPVNTRISQAFGNISPLYKGVTKGSRHLGVDIAVNAGTPLQLPVSGKVVVGNDPGGFGAYVKVLGTDGTEYRFSHLSEVSPQIIEAANRGLRVQEGTIFAKTGGVPGTQGSGRTTGAHLDITAKQKGKFVDPMGLDSVRRALS